MLAQTKSNALSTMHQHPARRVDSTYLLVGADKYVPTDMKYHRIMLPRTASSMIK